MIDVNLTYDASVTRAAITQPAIQTVIHVNLHKDYYTYTPKAIEQQNYSDTGVLDDIGDLRRYLLLVEAEMVLQKQKRYSPKKLKPPHYLNESEENEEGMLSDSCEWRTNE